MWELQPGRTPSHAASECDAQLAYRFNQALQAHEPLAVVGPVLRGEMQVQRLCRLRIPRAESCGARQEGGGGVSGAAQPGRGCSVGRLANGPMQKKANELGPAAQPWARLDSRSDVSRCARL